MIRNFLFAAACCVPAFAVTPITSCGQTLSTAGETYVLTADVTCTPAAPIAMRVVADDVVIDLQGFTLTGTGVAAGIITAAPAGCIGVKRLEVKNGVIQNFGTPVSLCAPGAAPVAMYAKIHNLAVRNSQMGILLGNVSGSVVKNNKFSGINVAQAPANPFITYRIGTAVYVDNSTKNKIENNDIDGSAANGIALDHVSSDNEVQRNTITNSGRYGIVIFGAGVSGAGTPYPGSDDNLVRGNRVSGSAVKDMNDENAACGSNDWIKNTFLTANQGCIH
jgi:parallel beta-helix repeat protein